MMNTIMGAAGGGLGSYGLKHRIMRIAPDTRFQITAACNGVLAGLVSVNAGCDSYHAWSALLVGFLGSLVYCFTCKWMLEFKIDDPLEAAMVHGFCGIFGTLIVAFFDTQRGILYGGNFGYLWVQMFGCAIIGVWSCMGSYLYFKGTYRGSVRLAFDEVIMEGGAATTNLKRGQTKSRAERLRELAPMDSEALIGLKSQRHVAK
eukprot:CAMPEP_0115020336 /NCGR_PEP_ID=MMETSP0216-20121206/30041_1 /TAXON_ID=223996 /ORGANISM="Protocruzia adherens, Strain Boccale" /LENGTH=203 /DNA_ID=CAMNT_0002392103 /DNA_START=994 /DNA_END=1605 /DNA_ORIENTATION=-